MNSNSGVYCIYNIVTGKFYVGSSGTLKERLASHRSDLKLNRHYAKYLQNSWNKRGKEDFAFKIIKLCPPEECLMWEQYYLNALDPEYNTCEIAGSQLGYRHTEETKKRMSECRIGIPLSVEHRVNIGLGNKGKILSEETKEKLRIFNLGKKHTDAAKLKVAAASKGRTHSEETKNKISSAHKGKPRAYSRKKVIQLCSKTSKCLGSFESIVEASKRCGISTINISHALNDRQKTAGGFIWKYDKN